MDNIMQELKDMEQTLFLLKYAIERGYQGDAEDYAETLMTHSEAMHETVVKWVEGK